MPSGPGSLPPRSPAAPARRSTRLVEALWPCYLAFQLGRATIAGQPLRAAVYRAKLAELSAAGAAFV